MAKSVTKAFFKSFSEIIIQLFFQSIRQCSMYDKPLYHRLRNTIRSIGLRLYVAWHKGSDSGSDLCMYLVRPGYYGNLLDHHFFEGNLVGVPTFRYHLIAKHRFPRHGNLLIRRIQSELLFLETSISFEPDGMATIYQTNLYRHLTESPDGIRYTAWYGDCLRYQHCFPDTNATFWQLRVIPYPRFRLIDRICKSIQSPLKQNVYHENP